MSQARRAAEVAVEIQSVLDAGNAQFSYHSLRRLGDALEAGGRFKQAKFQYLSVLMREPGQVGVGARDRFGQVHGSGPVAQRPGQVVVPVDQREPAQQVPRGSGGLTHPASLTGRRRAATGGTRRGPGAGTTGR